MILNSHGLSITLSSLVLDWNLAPNLGQPQPLAWASPVDLASSRPVWKDCQDFARHAPGQRWFWWICSRRATHITIYHIRKCGRLDLGTTSFALSPWRFFEHLWALFTTNHEASEQSSTVERSFISNLQTPTGSQMPWPQCTSNGFHSSPSNSSSSPSKTCDRTGMLPWASQLARAMGPSVCLGLSTFLNNMPKSSKTISSMQTISNQVLFCHVLSGRTPRSPPKKNSTTTRFLQLGSVNKPSGNPPNFPSWFCCSVPRLQTLSWWPSRCRSLLVKVDSENRRCLAYDSNQYLASFTRLYTCQNKLPFAVSDSVSVSITNKPFSLFLANPLFLTNPPTMPRLVMGHIQ